MEVVKTHELHEMLQKPMGTVEGCGASKLQGWHENPLRAPWRSPVANSVLPALSLCLSFFHTTLQEFFEMLTSEPSTPWTAHSGDKYESRQIPANSQTRRSRK